MQRASCALYGRGYGKWNFEGILKVLDTRLVSTPGRLAFSLPVSSLPIRRQSAGSEDAAPPMQEVLQVPLYYVRICNSC